MGVVLGHANLAHLIDGQRALTGPTPTAEACLQAIRLLARQLYNNGSSTTETKNGAAGVIVTCGDAADFTIIYWNHLCRAAFTSSFAKEAATMQLALEWATANQSIATTASSGPLPKISPQCSTGPDNPPMAATAQRNP